MKDTLKIYARIQKSLIAEKAGLEKRLEEINLVLGDAPVSPARAVPIKAGTTGKRAKNSMSLRAAVEQVAKDKPLSKEEILAGIKKLGYQFSTGNPVNSLNTVLYTGKNFKRVDGKFQAK